MRIVPRLKKNELVCEIFFAASSFLLVLLALETLQAGVVSAYLNLNYWLIGWVASGILYIYTIDTPS